MTEEYIQANGIQLVYEEFGEKDKPVVLLIMGLGTQMIAWPDSLCKGLADLGYRVIRFDNRDVGLSQKIEGGRVPGIIRLTLSARLNWPVKVPYRLDDMAADAVGLLDALDIKQAHLAGASMGGMISQIIAGRYPDRVLSLTSIMSTTGRRSLPGAKPEITRKMIGKPASTEISDLVAHRMQIYRLIGSPGFRATDEVLRGKIFKSIKRSYYPQGYWRQVAAIMTSGDRVALLKQLQCPTLVIHGKDDPLIPLACGEDTARVIPGARLEIIDGMGHDLPEPLVPRMLELIGGHVREADAGSSAEAA